ncbi:MAG: Dolichol-phosphate mannosyltransferase homolog [uncultured Sphingomonas sp.]|uniref:Dolichol-phosphate mannosyltransferase homolog n=1 Tax=uncultured Sphingomonas sp. TaxID=158754 RepID=A0A6J4THJ0_9SPHN|nr:glycosyltransferase family 2 protein [uncultured Sphingomonas sp.]CAA9523587.1 MAG: Dolichol-phosphate mannosyltransferase homolog [uncultured Sphingomonas sp.]
MFAYKKNEFFDGLTTELPGGFNEPLQLAVVIPTFNEHDNVEEMVGRLRRALRDIHWEAIFVDDNSPDGTASRIAEVAASDPRIRLVHRVGRRGLSSAVVEGMLASIAPVVAVIDADLQHDEAILLSLYRAVEGGSDLAVGTRYAAGGSIGSWSQQRAKVSQAGTTLARKVLGTELSDPMSGFFAIRRDALMSALPRLSSVGYKILLDIVASSPTRLEIAEVPYTFRERFSGASKLDSAILLEFALLLIDKTVGRWIPARFFMFAAVGGFGLLVHLAVLGMALELAQFSFRVAQGAAVLISMTGNYFINNQLTYRDRRRKGLGALTGLLSFYLICGLGGAANVGIGEVIYADGQTWWLAGLVGAAVGSVWNYAVTSCLTWRR